MSFTEEELRLAEPDDPAESVLEAWYMDDGPGDQRLPHRQTPNAPCSPATLRKLGVLSWRMDPDVYPADAKLKAIRRVRGYSYEDTVVVSPDKLEGYEAKLRAFFEEHIHSDEEIRYVREGSGYFDVRDLQDRWIRIATRRGDMIVLPAGIYHRFTLDEGNFITALRLFVGEPVWTPLNRPQDQHEARLRYLSACEGVQAA